MRPTHAPGSRRAGVLSIRSRQPIPAPISAPIPPPIPPPPSLAARCRPPAENALRRMPCGECPVPRIPSRLPLLPNAARSAAPRSAAKGPFRRICCKTGRALSRPGRVRKTGEPSDFPAHSLETDRELPGNHLRIIVLPTQLLRHNRQGAPGRRCLEKRGAARRCAQRGRPRPGRFGIFFRKMERSVQIGEAGQAPVFPAHSPKSDIERPRKNEKLRSSPVRALLCPDARTSCPRAAIRSRRNAASRKVREGGTRNRFRGLDADAAWTAPSAAPLDGGPVGCHIVRRKHYRLCRDRSANPPWARISAPASIPP